MLVCQTLVETSLVRPGLVEISDTDATVKLNEDRLNTLKIASVNKAKGNQGPLVLITTHKLIF